MLRQRLAATGSLIAVLTASAAHAEPTENHGVRGPATAPFAISIGSPTDGGLAGGVPLRERAELRLRWPEGPRWALPGLVEMLERVSRRVDRRFPGSVMLVGDLSRQDGGDLAGHASHESGRDADVGFYYRDPAGASVRSERLLAVLPSGRVSDAANLHFDDARNWALVEAILTDSKTAVERIFVAATVKRRLIDFAVHSKASGSIVARARSTLREPGSGPVHDDHFHVRVACPRSEREVCVHDPREARERNLALAKRER
jgi:penicillin-insensitive murein endopeptidase